MGEKNAPVIGIILGVIGGILLLGGITIAIILARKRRNKNESELEMKTSSQELNLAMDKKS